MNRNDFERFASLDRGISPMTMHRYQSVVDGDINPSIIEERKLNVASMDVFSRLMMERIIFLGAPIYDDAANIIQAQLLFLESVDPLKDIQLYIKHACKYLSPQPRSRAATAQAAAFHVNTELLYYFKVILDISVPGYAIH